MIALGYIRRSKASTKRTVSLEEQAAQIERYCQAHGWTLVMLPPDDGVSGGRRDRLQRIQAAVQAHRAGAVVVYHLDRFARDVAALLDTLAGWSKQGVELHGVGRGRIEADSASGYLMTTVEGMMAEHYRRLIGEKTRDALARLKAQGRRYSGMRPYGWDDPAEAATLAHVQAALRANGHSLRAISRELAAQGVLARSGRPFAPSTLLRLQSVTRSVIGAVPPPHHEECVKMLNSAIGRSGSTEIGSPNSMSSTVPICSRNRKTRPSGYKWAYEHSPRL